ncbi:MAG: hypothetical protein LBV19_00025 [Streptococcaceae bacterium]|jgi:predicted nucleic acid-binding protein|nr:hypothetical protein [Streptococcaceae bacterium]
MMEIRILLNTDVALDFLTKNGEKTKQAQMIIRESLFGRYEVVITSETVSEINYRMLEAGMSIGQARECMSTLLNLISVIDTNEADCQQALSRTNELEFDNVLTAESARRNKISVIVTDSKNYFENLGLNLFSPKEFLALRV